MEHFDIAQKRYLKGKSLDSIVDYLNEQKIEEEKIYGFLSDLHRNSWYKRKQVAIRDIGLASVFVFYVLGKATLMLVQNEFDVNALFFIALFAWIPFGRSGYEVLTSKKEFDKLLTDS
ncbi:MAG: hypothetical protein GY827_06230 [Cytophagales bacterium]|nr:hypothetical protein [Cytophagales bacterium]